MAGRYLTVFDPEALRECRAAAGLSQRQAAEAIGADERSIRRYERSEMEPTAGVLARLANAYDCSVVEFYPLEEAEAVNGIRT